MAILEVKNLRKSFGKTEMKTYEVKKEFESSVI